MKSIIALTLLSASLSTVAAPVYKCGNLYTDNVKLCNTPVTLSINAAPAPVADPTRTCQTTQGCVITKESK